jgi:broad specificity phosphatase PhoE
MPRRLLLARHGETEWNALGRLQGHTDIPLNDRGKQQARDLAAALRAANVGVRHVVTSDLARARETGAIVADELGLDAPRVIADLRERKFGLFEGLTRGEINERHPEAWKAWQTLQTPPHGGEPLAAATARVHAVLEQLIGEGGDPALVISHGGVMRLWLLEVLGTRLPPLHNGVTYEIEHDGARFTARILFTDGRR